MTKEEIIKKLRDMAKYPTVTMPRDTEALRNAADLLEQAEQIQRVAGLNMAIIRLGEMHEKAKCKHNYYGHAALEIAKLKGEA